MGYHLALSSINQHIAFTALLYPSIYLLVLLTGALVPFVLLFFRQNELHIMKRCGATPARRFLSIYLEVGGLGALGMLLSLLIMLASSTQLSQRGLWMAGVFSLIWFLSAAVALFISLGNFGKRI